MRMSERMVLRIKARSDDEVVRGRRGKRDLRRLARRSGMGRETREKYRLDGRDHIFVSEYDEVLHESLACVRCENGIVFEYKTRKMSRKLCGLFWITNGDLSDKSDEFSKVSRIFVWVDDEELSDAVVVVVLLQKLFLVPRWIAFDQVL